MPPKPAAERATSSAACGGQTDRITSAWLDISPAEPTSRIPAAAARSAVAGLRPADAHSTVSPRLVRHAPTAAPISPGCSTPITVWSTVASGTSLAYVPGLGGVHVRQCIQLTDDARWLDLPDRPGVEARVRCSRQRDELVPSLHAEFDLVTGRVAALRVLDWRSWHVRQHDQRAARGVRPQHVLGLPRVQPGDRPPAQDLHDLPGGG